MQKLLADFTKNRHNFLQGEMAVRAIRITEYGRMNTESLAYLASLLMPDWKEDASFRTRFFKNPAKACASYLERMAAREREGQTLNNILLGTLFRDFWAAALKDGTKKGQAFNPVADDQRHFEALVDKFVVRNSASRKDEKKWENIDWAFPDNVIGKIMGVTRQAAAARRINLDPEYKACVNGDPGKLYETMAACRDDMVAEELGISRSTAMRLRRISVEILAQQMASLPDMPEEDQKAALEIQMSEDCNFTGVPDALEWMAAVKGTGKFEAARLVLAANPQIDADENSAIAEKIGLKPENVSWLRKNCHDWREKLAMIPGNKNCSTGFDPLDGLAADKGIAPHEAARLLWLVFGKQANIE